MAEHAPKLSPIFVVGSMRSGSTLLRLILDSHPDIAVGPESGFMGAVSATKHVPNWRYGERWYERFGWTEAEFDAHLGQFYATVFERYAASRGKRRWGEKTPFHALHLHDMASLFPTAVFVGIVRHPGAVASSLDRRWQYSFDDSLADWVRVNMAIAAGAGEVGDARFRLCRYEDLVFSPEPVLRELFQFLDEPWSDAVLDHGRSQREQGAPRLVDGGTRSRQPIDARSAAKWRNGAERHELDAIAAVAGELAGRLGYVTDEPMPAAWPSGSRLLDATSLLRAVDGVTAPPARRGLAGEATKEELDERLQRAEASLARLRRRRAVRYVDAFRRAQRAGSFGDLRAALHEIRRPSRKEESREQGARSA
jgi:hypothetical protein